MKRRYVLSRVEKISVTLRRVQEGEPTRVDTESKKRP